MLETNDNQLNETEAIEFLKRGLLLGTGFQLYLVAANTVDQRSSIAQYVSEISELTTLVIEGTDIDVQKTLVKTLLENFQMLDNRQSRPVIILTEIEEVVIENPRALSHLNTQRNELIRGFSGALLILGSTQLIARLRNEAPDTWSVRAADLEMLEPLMSIDSIEEYVRQYVSNLVSETLTNLSNQIIPEFKNSTPVESLDVLNGVLKLFSPHDMESIAQLRLLRAGIYVDMKDFHQAIDELRSTERDLAKINNIPLIQQIRLLLGFAAIQAGLTREARYTWFRFLTQTNVNDKYTIHKLVEIIDKFGGEKGSVITQKAWQIINSLSQELNLYLPDTLHEENPLDDVSADNSNETLDEFSPS